MFTVEMRLRPSATIPAKLWGGIHAQYGDVPSYFGALFSTKEAAEAYVADADAKYPSSERRIIEADASNAIHIGDRVQFKAGRLNQLEGHKGWISATVSSVFLGEVTVLADYRAAKDAPLSFKGMHTACNIHDIRKSKKG